MMPLRIEGATGRALGVALVVLVALIASGCTERERHDPVRNVLLVTVDTLRADALGFGGADGDPSPELDRLAAESLVFDRAYTQATHTHAALSSILTGLVPPRHAVVAQRGRLAGGATSIAVLLQAQGFATGSFVANLCKLQEIEGTVLHEGWDDRHCAMDLDGVRHGQEQYLWDENAVAAARAWIAEQTGPWFCWVHLMDPHAEHRPPPDLWDYDAHPLPSKDDELGRHGTYEREGHTPPADELAELHATYAAEVRGTDRTVAELVRFVDALPEPERPAIVFTSDHGEELFETWSKVGHGLSLTEGVLHVPLFVRAPGVEPGTVDDYVDVLRVAPTILDLTDVAPAERLDGPSLFADPLGPASFTVSFCGQVATLRAGDERLFWRMPKLVPAQEIEDYLQFAPHFRKTPWFTDPVAFARYEPASSNQPVWQDVDDSPQAVELQDRVQTFVTELGRLPFHERIEDAEFDRELRELGYLGER